MRSMFGFRAQQFFFVVADVATEKGCSTLASEADRRMDGIDGLVSRSIVYYAY